ncbi:MAG: formimidoylglutamate deiminase [Actinomycetia bacterium]|nr:formimidoylglutamate deiminase [Actinomycetes bacterium]
MTEYVCDLALIDGRVEEQVLIRVADGRFEHVEPGGQTEPSATRLRGLTLAGLANAHSHAFHRALRSRTQADRGSFWTWRDLMYTAAGRLDPDNYHRLARATFAEMALAGITSVGEFHYVHHQPDGTPYQDLNAMGEAVLAAAAEAGIRITLLDTLYLHGGLAADGYLPPEGTQRRFSDATADDWVGRVEQLSPGSNQLVGAAIHSVRAVDPTSMKLVAEWAGHQSVPIHAHVSEQEAENDQCRARHDMTPTEVLHDAEVLGDRFSAVHATHLTTHDIELLAATGSTVCVCPTTEHDLGDGIGPTTELVTAGVAIALGSDSHAIIDQFEECRAIELDERARSRRRGHHSVSELLAMATTTGQASLGWPDAGLIRPGQRADLVTITLDSVRTAGITTDVAAAAAVFAATAADVTHVIIDGTPIIEDGHHRRFDVTTELHASIHDLMDR